jgi:uncharacterized RDD family membrane protein YckC
MVGIMEIKMNSDAIGDNSKRRIFAMSIDNLIAGICGFLVASQFPDSISIVTRSIVASIIYLGYFLVQEGVCSTTLGKSAFGLRVYKVDGSSCGWTCAAIRTILRLVEVNPILLGALPGGIVVAASKRHQRMGDLMANTIVVRKYRSKPK